MRREERKKSVTKKEGGRGRESGGDADQLITAANKMQIYPGTRTKFKHGTVQKRRAARARGQARAAHRHPIVAVVAIIKRIKMKHLIIII